MLCIGLTYFQIHCNNTIILLNKKIHLNKYPRNVKYHGNGGMLSWDRNEILNVVTERLRIYLRELADLKTGYTRRVWTSRITNMIGARNVCQERVGQLFYFISYISDVIF